MGADGLVMKKNETLPYLRTFKVKPYTAYAHRLVLYICQWVKCAYMEVLLNCCIVTDFCAPFPEHGECKEGKLECLQGYRKHGKLCVEDGDINETTRKLVHCENLCNLLPKDEIRNDLYEDKLEESVDMDIAHHAYTKERAMETIGKILKKRTNPNGYFSLTLSSLRQGVEVSDFLAKQYQTFLCYIRQWIWEHALVLVP
ncbi:hypothetical protein RJ641_035188 [Dillenia turbinata]|uniref:Uncharacterized protein n=1 Tax=Dillenia turbinata TaxID=194707 RepID=A0AAN8VH86_9MAGN